MARGNSTRRNLAPEDISKLIRGDKTALQGQAAKGGNAPATAPTPAPAAQPTPAPAPAQNPAVPTTQPLSQAEVDELRNQLAADAAKEQQVKDYFKNLQLKNEFESEQAAEAAREAAFKAWATGQQSLAQAAAMASPKNAQKAGLANANKEEKASKKKGAGKEAKGPTPWYLRSGRGPGSIIFGRGSSGNINEMNVGGGADEVVSEALNNLRRKAGVNKNFILGKMGGTPPAAPSGPSK